MAWAMRETEGDVKAGDDTVRRPFEEVYCDLADIVFRFCVTQVGSLAVAEEVTAQTFAAALAAYDRFQPSSDPRPWLLRIARNAAIDHRRRTHRGTALLARLSRFAGMRSSSIEELAEVRDDVRRVTIAIAALPTRDRQLVGLRLAAQLSFQEMALVTGRTPAAVRRATERALRRLRQSMEA